MQLTDLITRKAFVNWESPLTSVLEAMKSDGTPYRVPVVDSGGKFRGIINKRRILEVLIGVRGSAIRGKEGVRSLMDEPVFILIDESYQVFQEGTPIKMVLEYMAENFIGHVVVVDQNNNYKGIVEEQDVLRNLVGKRLKTPVEQVMKKDVLCIRPEALINEAAKIMVERRVRRLPVVKKGSLRGIITIGQVVEHIHTQIQKDKMALEDVGVPSDRVETIFTKEVQTCLPSMELGQAITIMLQRNISGMPVTTKKRKVVGIFARVDAVVALVHGLGSDSMSELMG
jgi:CBS domain-containing protein